MIPAYCLRDWSVTASSAADVGRETCLPDEQGNWRLLCKTRGKLQPGEFIVLTDRGARDDVRLRMLTQLSEGTWAARPETMESTWDLLERIGRVPLPEYIRGGHMMDDDLRWYQTVYATHPGSVAAPTAGLHLTEKLLQQLSERGVTVARVTLHVGLGTFRPIKTEQVEAHRMHAESGQVSSAAVQQIEQARGAGGRGRRGDQHRAHPGNGGRGGTPGPLVGTDGFVHPAALSIPYR